MTDATNTLEHLAPCPFCLGKAELEEIDLPLGTGYYVACTQCDGQMGDTDDTWNSPEYAIRKWNIRRAPQPAQAQTSAKQQYLAGANQLIVTRAEWNERYVDGWNDGNNDAKQGGEQVCDVCEGDGETEDYSHLSPPVYGDWPMITCWKCNGTGIKPQPAQAQAEGNENE